MLMTAASTGREHVPLLFTQAAVSLLECATRDGLCCGFHCKIRCDGNREVKILDLIFFMKAIAVYCRW